MSVSNTTAVEMECGRIEIVTPIPSGTKTASTSFFAYSIMKYSARSGSEEDAFYPASKVLESATTITPEAYYIVGINQQTGKTYTETWDGTSSNTEFGTTWDEGYYRVHIVYKAIVDGETVSVNLEKLPMYWNRSVISWMTYIAPGSYICGSPSTEIGHASNETQHRVTLTQGFYIARTQMTNAQYNSIMGTTGGTANAPVASICWSYFNGEGKHYQNSAWEYIDAAPSSYGKMCYKSTGKQGSASGADLQTPDGLFDVMKASSGLAVTGYTWDLPTEAQWEYACRAGVGSALPSGKNNSFSDSTFDKNEDEVAWYGGNNTPAGTKVIARKMPNRWGLYDTIGNVWEWLYDYNRSYSTAAETNPIGSTTSSARGARGGSYGGTASLCRCAYRNGIYVSSSSSSFGLRPSLQATQA